MTPPTLNYLAVLVAGILIFLIGGLWYSPVLFAKPWIAAMGKSEEQLKAEAARMNMPASYGAVFLCGLVTAWALAILVAQFSADIALEGALVGVLAWLGFAATTSLGTSMFSMQPTRLWVINTAYNLVAFAAAGILLAVWR